ncbi:MAG: hypothetical protein JWO82_2245 [Akkermansiaceae bacterium]|nr:hypothetical protein [Akkermansiaceae bacterium]
MKEATFIFAILTAAYLVRYAWFRLVTEGLRQKSQVLLTTSIASSYDEATFSADDDDSFEFIWAEAVADDDELILAWQAGRAALVNSARGTAVVERRRRADKSLATLLSSNRHEILQTHPPPRYGCLTSCFRKRRVDHAAAVSISSSHEPCLC